MCLMNRLYASYTCNQFSYYPSRASEMESSSINPYVVQIVSKTTGQVSFKLFQWLFYCQYAQPFYSLNFVRICIFKFFRFFKKWDNNQGSENSKCYSLQIMPEYFQTSREFLSQKSTGCFGFLKF